MVSFPLMMFIAGDFVRPKYVFIGMAVQFLVTLFGYMAEVTALIWLKMLFVSVALALYSFILFSMCLVFTSLINSHETMQTLKGLQEFEMSQHSHKALGVSCIVIWTTSSTFFLLNNWKVISEQTYLLFEPVLDVMFKTIFLGLLFAVQTWSNEIKMVEMFRELKNQNKFQSKFLRFVYHEIRNPFNTIMLGLDHLQTEVKGLKQLELVSTLRKCAKSMNRVIDDAVELTTNQGTLELLKEPTNIEFLLNDVVEEYAILADSKRLSFNTHVPKNFPDHVYADSAKLRKIFQILISNAVKFSPVEELVKIILKVNNFLPPNQVMLSLSIIDNGPGISEEILPVLFEPFGFVRPGDFSEDEDRGSGLGLCMAQQLANLMDAKLTVETVLGQGSSFNIFFVFNVCPKENSVSKSQSKSKSFFNGPLSRRWSLVGIARRRNAVSPTSSHPSQALPRGPTEDFGMLTFSNGADLVLDSAAMHEEDLASSVSSALERSSPQNLLSSLGASLGVVSRLKTTLQYTSEFKNSPTNQTFLRFSPTNFSPKQRMARFFSGDTASKSESPPPRTSEVAHSSGMGRSSETSSDVHQSMRTRHSGPSENAMTRSSAGRTKILFAGDSSRKNSTRNPYPQATRDISRNLIPPGSRCHTVEDADAPPALILQKWGSAPSHATNRKKQDKADRHSAFSSCGSFLSWSDCSVGGKGTSQGASSEGSCEGASVHPNQKKGQEPVQNKRTSILLKSSLDTRESCCMQSLKGQEFASSASHHNLLESFKASETNSTDQATNSQESDVCMSLPVAQGNIKLAPVVSHIVRSDKSSYSTENSSKEAPVHPGAPPSITIKSQILIVDDVKSNVKLAEMILTKAGFCCDIAHNGLEAINLVRQKHYELILMDNVMPHMSGIDATREILCFDKETTIVGLTGNILKSDQDEFLKAGAKFVLQKPIDKVMLLNTCHQFVQLKGSSTCS